VPYGRRDDVVIVTALSIVRFGETPVVVTSVEPEPLETLMVKAVAVDVGVPDI